MIEWKVVEPGKDGLRTGSLSLHRGSISSQRDGRIRDDSNSSSGMSDPSLPLGYPRTAAMPLGMCLVGAALVAALLLSPLLGCAPVPGAAHSRPSAGSSLGGAARPAVWQPSR